MVQLTCEICGSNELIKQDGVFVCQFCKCKYSVEEARKMMVEINGPVEVTGTVRIDNSTQADNFIQLSLDAYKSDNFATAYEYALRALEISPKNRRSWICKMKAVSYLSTPENFRIKELTEAGNNAISFASEAEKQDIICEVHKSRLQAALHLLHLADSKACNTEYIVQVFKKHSLEDEETASVKTLNEDSDTLKACVKISEKALEMINTISDREIAESRVLSNLLSKFASEYSSFHMNMNNRYHTYKAEEPIAENLRRLRLSYKLKEKADTISAYIDKREQEEAKRRFDEYWTINADKKAALEAERNDLDNAIAGLQAKVRAIKGMDEVQAVQQKIESLRDEKKAISILKQKARKAVQEQIDAAQRELDALFEMISPERTALENQIKPLSERSKAITHELTMPR